RVAGKTGTAQKVDPGTGRYHPRDRMSSFIGFVPADDPALVISVVIDTPRTATYGGVVAAPVFRAVPDDGLMRRGALAPAAEPEPAPAPRQRARAAGAARPVAAAVVPEAETADPFEDIAAPGGVPSFLGLAMREALVRAQDEGWSVRVEGSGYVARQ